ncbi:MAG TPA: family 78 glycoside hydrolase catalytic domain, partial [Opitutus sp.]|nr:family 78 glycoside hydrolase catalytic domain [Opitutus sp.]
AGAEKYAIFYPEAARLDFRDRKAFAVAHPHAVPRDEPNYSSLLARREFEAKPELVRAVVHVCGLGHYELSVNGRKVGDELLSPGWTDYRKTVLYDTFDITRHLTAGRNAIGLILSNGMYNIQPDYERYVKFLNSYGPLKAIAQVRLEYANGAVETFGTDATWQVSPGPVTYSNLFGGEDYDARKEQVGWDRPGFEAARAWDAALETEGPGGTLRGLSAAAPPLKAVATLTPLNRTRLNATTWVYDLGQNTSIMPRLRVRGPAGSAVRIIPAELLGPDGAVDRRSATQDGVRPAWWQYTLAEAAPAEWRAQFFYQGARYLQVELLPARPGGALPEVEQLTGLVVHTSAEPIGEFSCSNELFNRVHTLVRWAQRSNLVSIITDCPHREKMGWLEQYHLNGPSLRYNYDLLTLFRKAMNDMADSQLENGFVPNIAPEFFIAGGEELTNGFRNSPEWGSAFILVPWQQYLFSGDTALITDYYDRMKRYLAFLASTAEDHIVPFGLGDWYDLGPKPPWGSQLTPVPFTATAIYYYDNVVMAEMAKLVGRPDDAREFERRAREIRASFNRRFFNAETGTYATGSQTANALPLFLELVEPQHRSRLADAIVADIRARGNAFTSGDVGYRFLLKALAMEGRSEVIFDMNNQTEKPGYGYQLKRGATALTEKWDASVGDFGSHNHFMLGQINEWFYHDLAGIGMDPAAPGFRNAIVKPSVVGDLVWVKGRYETVRGPIATVWRRENGALVLECSIPAGATATVFVPASNADEVTEGGRPAARAPHVNFLRMEAGAAVFAVGSGTYRFVAPDSVPLRSR